MKRNEVAVNQFLKYAFVGGIASMADISVFSAGTNIFRMNYIIANIFSFATGLVVNYLLSSKWVFHMGTYNAADFLLFSVVGVIGLVLSSVLLYILIDFKVLYHITLSSNDNVIKPLAKIITTGIVLLWNFTARRKLAFSA